MTMTRSLVTTRDPGHTWDYVEFRQDGDGPLLWYGGAVNSTLTMQTLSHPPTTSTFPSVHQAVTSMPMIKWQMFPPHHPKSPENRTSLYGLVIYLRRLEFGTGHIVSRSCRFSPVGPVVKQPTTLAFTTNVPKVPCMEGTSQKESPWSKINFLLSSSLTRFLDAGNPLYNAFIKTFH